MATKSFDSAIKVTKKSAESFRKILDSDKKLMISKTPTARDIDARELSKFFRK